MRTQDIIDGNFVRGIIIWVVGNIAVYWAFHNFTLPPQLTTYLISTEIIGGSIISAFVSWAMGKMRW